MKAKTLGVLGGLGPMSSVYFYEMLTIHTMAQRDQEHLNILLSSRADTPDRTDYILGRSAENPLHTMLAEAEKLTAAGAEILAIPCNTAHYFYDGICAAIPIPVINIIRETADFCHFLGIRKAGVLATEGTIASGVYQSILADEGIDCIICNDDDKRIITDLIYQQVKRGLPPDTEAFLQVAAHLRENGCQRIILGCTELSLVGRQLPCRDGFIDSLEVLALSAIRQCGKQPIGFSEELMQFFPKKGTKLCC